MKRFKGKVALVTGAGGGIGLATAKRIAEEGGTVVAGLLDESQRAAIGTLDGVVLDVRSEQAWDAAMDYVAGKYGGLDVLVNNAGISPQATAEETSWEMWDDVMAVNLKGTFIGCKKAIPLMRKRGGGAIVNLASINAIRGNTRLVAYAATKGAVLAMTMSLALDHVSENIRVNCVCPATIETDMVRQMLSEAADLEAATRGITAKHPIGRMAQPEEVASTIAFLASGDASFMTGLAIPVDGGRSIR
ncbi:MAG TPA: SDR family NAD(P)-dependent oxidoreductase [Burkholderiales bacterium]|nr:SDR family NAD(P)-dependent oxidoreductase [Burkholderiales bacterium]